MKKNYIVYDMETSSLEPFLPDSRIYCIAIKAGEEERVFLDEDEKRLLQAFWGYIKRFSPFFVIVGFHNFNFDDNFLLARTFHHSIRCINFRDKSLDIRRTFTGNGFKKGDLNNFAELIGVEGKIGNGEDVKKLWEEKRYEELKAYCLQDVKITHKLLQRLQEIGWLE